jgi:predicted O-methyltransferase YrrM
MEIAFKGNYSKAQIKERLDKAMKLYNVPLTNEYYSRAGSVLVVLRKEIGPSEMAILSYMIRSHVPGVAIEFPGAAGLSASFLAAGDK